MVQKSGKKIYLDGYTFHLLLYQHRIAQGGEKMSFPNIPNVTPTITISTTEVKNLLLASIAFEELGLAHIINAEAEKIQAAVGTLTATGAMATSVSQLLSVNQSVNRTLQTVLKTQMLLQFKLEDAADIPEVPVTPIPSILIQKYVSINGGATWIDADTPPGPLLPPQTTPLLIRFVVLNNGQVTLSNIVVTDSVYGLIGAIPSLPPGAQFEWILTVPWELGPHENVATATGVYNNVVYTDSDPLYYLGV